jgi:hypothetical protein
MMKDATQALVALSYLDAIIIIIIIITFQEEDHHAGEQEAAETLEDLEPPDRRLTHQDTVRW